MRLERRRALWWIQVRVVDHEGMTRRLEVAGEELTAFLVRELMERGIPLTTMSDRMMAKAMKEKLCYVALDYEGGGWGGRDRGVV